MKCMNFWPRIYIIKYKQNYFFCQYLTVDKVINKRILIFSTAYFPLVGGAEVAVKEITDRIKEYQFDLITARIRPKLSPKDRFGRVNIFRVGLGIGFLDKLLLPFLGLAKAIQLDKKANYPIIWALMASQGGIAAAFFKLLKPDKKLLLTLQEGDTESHLKRYVFNLDWLYRLLIRPFHFLPIKKADYLTAISNYLKERAVQSGAKGPIKIVPNGVDIEKFSPGYNPKELKNALGIGQRERVILTISRLVKKNAVADLIRSAKYLDSSHRILIIGDGPDREKLVKLAKKQELEQRILFLGEIDHSRLREYIALADVFVRPSLSEGLGNVFLEAMASGAPIVGTPVGGIPDFLKDRETGLFCQVGNPRDIAKKIKKILKDDELRKQLTKNGLALVRQKYSWKFIARQMEKIFNKLCG